MKAFEIIVATKFLVDSRTWNHFVAKEPDSQCFKAQNPSFWVENSLNVPHLNENFQYKNMA